MGHLQVKNLPDDLYEVLRERARAQHTSISALVRDILTREAQRLSVAEWLDELRPRPKLKGQPVEMEALMDEVRGRPAETRGRTSRSA